ncbi:hypothetical protein K438DRAFT_2002047 [Mycena galopus ATCC 62051]|nr:hypothetical protein K438DRAFT_2002047 [Mycena galopus ATCC 62051]
MNQPANNPRPSSWTRPKMRQFLGSSPATPWVLFGGELFLEGSDPHRKAVRRAEGPPSSIRQDARAVPARRIIQGPPSSIRQDAPAVPARRIIQGPPSSIRQSSPRLTPRVHDAPFSAPVVARAPPPTETSHVLRALQASNARVFGNISAPLPPRRRTSTRIRYARLKAMGQAPFPVPGTDENSA